jgi:hypothetical protein
MSSIYYYRNQTGVRATLSIELMGHDRDKNCYVLLMQSGQLCSVLSIARTKWLIRELTKALDHLPREAKAR